MKRKDLLRYLELHRCEFIREGARHSLFYNPALQRYSTIPRHNEIESFLAKKICLDLGLEPIQKK